MNDYDNNINAYIFANQLLINGISRDARILEISDSKQGNYSVTSILNGWKDNYSFLLSKNYSDKNVKGEKGELTTIPRVDFNIRSKHSIDSFDTIISEGYNTDAMFLGSLQQDIYAGYCTSLDDPRIKELNELYRSLYSQLRLNAMKNNKDCTLIERKLKANEKQLCLIIKR